MPMRTTGEIKYLKCTWVWVDASTLLYHVQDLTAMRNMAERLDQKVIERTAELEAANKQLERVVNEVQEKEQFLNQVFDSIQEGICVLDPDMNVLKVNKTMEKLYDLEPTIIGDKCYNVFQNNRQKVCEFCPALKSIKEKVPNKAIVHALHGKNQTDIWTEVFTFPILDASDKVTGIIEFVRDITQRKRIEEALKTSEAQLNEAQRIARIGSWELDLSTNILSWSGEVCRIFDLEPQEFPDTYEGFLDKIHPEDKELVDRAFTNSVLNKAPYEIVHRLLLADNVLKYVRERCETFYDDAGKACRSLGTVQDVTESVLAEKALRNSEEKYRTLIENLSSGVVVHAADSSIILSNPMASTLLGLTLDQMRGKQAIDPAWNFLRTDGTVMPVNEYPVNRVLKSAKPVFNHGLGICRSDLIEPVWAICHAYPVFNKDEELETIIVTFIDITERKKAEQERLELEAQLRQKHKMEAVGYMAGGMAHNFNNNLGIILGNVELSQLKVQDPIIQGLLKNAKTAIMRSRDLVAQIITYSRKGIQNKAPMTLLAVVDETISLLSSTLPSTINLQKSVGPKCGSTFIHADASQIQEILINLCNNAVHAMDGKGDLIIALEPVDLGQKDIPIQYDGLPGRYAKMIVQDTGCGMPAEMLDKIFDPFYTTKEDYEGAGMGLATVQGIVAQHSGLIKVESILGQGTVFNLYFPMTNEIATEPETEDSSLPRGTERILFVDDDEMLASLGERLLTQHGYQVTMMLESSEALKLFAANSDRFNLVITDQTMPDLTGEELIQEVKKISPDMPTILCTGYSSKIDEDKAKELGINAFLMKPLDLPKLLQTVRRVLDGERNSFR